MQKLRIVLKGNFIQTHSVWGNSILTLNLDSKRQTTVKDKNMSVYRFYFLGLTMLNRICLKGGKNFSYKTYQTTKFLTWVYL